MTNVQNVPQRSIVPRPQMGCPSARTGLYQFIPKWVNVECSLGLRGGKT